MRSLPYKLGTTKNLITSRAGLVTVSEVMDKINLAGLAKKHMPQSKSHRAFGADEMVVTMMYLLHNDGKCLEDIRGLHDERDLLKLFGLKRLASVRTLGNVLHRWGENDEAMQGLVEVNRALIGLSLGSKRTKVTLDIDATAIEAHKADAKWTYKNYKGYMPMVGHLVETEQVAAIDFRDGNVPPNKANLQFIKQCEASLPKGVTVSKVRIDAAGYQSDVINDLMDSGKGFAIRAKMDDTVKESISSIKAEKWKVLIYADGSESKTQEVARTVHVMGETEAFTLVVQRKRINQGDNASLETFIEAGDDAVTRGEYMYRAIATNLDKKTDHGIVHWYNLRGETSENKIKQFRSDFAGARLPCSDFGANAVWVMVNALAYNLLCLLRMMLPKEWMTSRAPTIRYHIYAAGGHVVRHARRLTIKVSQSNWTVLDRALRSIRLYPLLS